MLIIFPIALICPLESLDGRCFEALPRVKKGVKSGEARIFLESEEQRLRYASDIEEIFAKMS